MVDFKNENTITTPNYQIVSVITLEAWLNCVVSFEILEINDPDADDYHNITTCQARLKALYRTIRPWLLEIKGNPYILEIQTKLDSRKFSDLESVFNELAIFLFQNGLLKINLKRPINTIVAEELNIDKGY